MRPTHLTLVVLSLLLSGSLLLGFSGHLMAQPFGGGPGGGPGGLFSNLSDEQRDAVRDLMEQMRAAGAARQEIQAAISELFAQWGIEMPQRPGGPGGQPGGHHQQGRIGDELTEDQRATLHSMILQLWQDGISRKEIHQAITEQLRQWGIDPPGRSRDEREPGEFGQERGGFWSQLTDEQREAIRETIAQLRDQEATREQIHEAVKALLEEWGVELPEHRGPGQGMGQRGHFLRDIFDQLNEEQREEIHRLIREWRQQGLSRDEVRAAVEGKLAEWGIELPEPLPELTQEQRQALRAVIFELWKSGATGEEIHSAAAQQFQEFGLQVPEHERGPGGQTPWPDISGCLTPPLTREQRETLHQTTRKLRQQGESPEEIRQAVRSFMSELGIDAPDLDAELTEEQRATLRATILDLWLAGASREDICQTARDLLDDFGIELPEDLGHLDPSQTADEAPIRAQNYPNPANPETQIDYTLGVSGDVKMQIYNISGQLVRTYDIGYQRQGSYSVQWDGRHQNGQPVASGIYFYRIQAGQHAVTNRMVVLK